MPRLRLIRATSDHLAAFLDGPSSLAALLASPLPAGWPEFPEAFPHTLERLREHADEADWWMHFFLDHDTGVLVGSGGYSGPPRDRCVEIGYEIAPPFRRQGYGTAAAALLVDAAFASGHVDRVTAHTRAGDERSEGVLRATGFRALGDIVDPVEGPIRAWERDRVGSRAR